MSFDLKLENGDILLGSDGGPQRVFNDDKLRQDIIKIILTPLGSNQLFQWYGSPLTERAIGKVLDKRILDMEMSNSIIYALNNLMALQEEQEKTGQYVSPAEAIGQILNVEIEPSVYDSRQINISIAVASRRSNVISESFELRI